MANYKASDFQSDKSRKPVNADTDKRVRKPIGNMRRLDVSHLENDPKFEGKVLAWFNNEAGQIPRLMQIGWEPVRGDAYTSVWRPDAKNAAQKDSVVSAPVGVGREGVPIDAILMMIDKEIHDELQGMKQAHVDNIDRAMRQSQSATAVLDTAEKDLETYSPYTGVGTDKGMSIKNE